MRRSLDLATVLLAIGAAGIGWMHTPTRYVLPLLAAGIVLARLMRGVTALTISLFAIAPTALWIGWHDRAFVLGAIVLGAAAACGLAGIERREGHDHDVVAAARASLTVALVVAGASMLAFGMLFR